MNFLSSYTPPGEFLGLPINGCVVFESCILGLKR